MKIDASTEFGECEIIVEGWLFHFKGVSLDVLRRTQRGIECTRDILDKCHEEPN
jgi:hypothetical protein